MAFVRALGTGNGDDGRYPPMNAFEDLLLPGEKVLWQSASVQPSGRRWLRLAGEVIGFAVAFAVAYWLLPLYTGGERVIVPSLIVASGLWLAGRMATRRPFGSGLCGGPARAVTDRRVLMIAPGRGLMQMPRDEAIRCSLLHEPDGPSILFIHPGRRAIRFTDLAADELEVLKKTLCELNASDDTEGAAL
jgi:hypothetical protein